MKAEVAILGSASLKVLQSLWTESNTEFELRTSVIFWGLADRYKSRTFRENGAHSQGACTLQSTPQHIACVVQSHISVHCLHPKILHLGTLPPFYNPMSQHTASTLQSYISAHCLHSTILHLGTLPPLYNPTPQHTPCTIPHPLYKMGPIPRMPVLNNPTSQHTASTLLSQASALCLHTTIPSLSTLPPHYHPKPQHGASTLPSQASAHCMHCTIPCLITLPAHYNPMPQHTASTLQSHISAHCLHTTIPRLSTLPAHYNPTPEHTACTLQSHASTHCLHTTIPRLSTLPALYNPAPQHTACTLQAHASAHCLHTTIPGLSTLPALYNPAPQHTASTLQSKHTDYIHKFAAHYVQLSSSIFVRTHLERTAGHGSCRRRGSVRLAWRWSAGSAAGQSRCCGSTCEAPSGCAGSSGEPADQKKSFAYNIRSCLPSCRTTWNHLSSPQNHVSVLGFQFPGLRKSLDFKKQTEHAAAKV